MDWIQIYAIIIAFIITVNAIRRAVDTGDGVDILTSTAEFSIFLPIFLRIWGLI